MTEFTDEQLLQIQTACAEHIVNCLIPFQVPNMDDVDEFAISWWGSEIDNVSVSTAIEEGMMSSFAVAVLEHFHLK